jgi:hypothetical protein
MVIKKAHTRGAGGDSRVDESTKQDKNVCATVQRTALFLLCVLRITEDVSFHKQDKDACPVSCVFSLSDLAPHTTRGCFSRKRCWWFRRRVPTGGGGQRPERVFQRFFSSWNSSSLSGRCEFRALLKQDCTPSPKMKGWRSVARSVARYPPSTTLCSLLLAVCVKRLELNVFDGCGLARPAGVEIYTGQVKAATGSK